MKKLILLSILLLPVIINAQDIIFTVSGEINEEKVTLNSIHFENISNGTGILFDSLPEVDDYQINLTQKSYWGTTGISAFEKPSKFVVSQNTPGKLVVLYNLDQPTDLRVSIYNINGQKVYASGKRILQGKNSIRVQLGLPHLFLVKLETASESQTFKVVGSENRNGYNVEISDEYNLKGLKGIQVDFDNEFSFSVGDSIRISAFKSGYYAEPVDLKVTGSQAVNFLFEESQNTNFLKINDNEYELSDGIIVYNHEMYLISPEHNFDFETWQPDGTGAVINFEILNTREDIESGIYYLSTPEEMNTDTVCDVDVNGDELINEQDCVYKLPEGKFYISSRSSIYDDDANLHNFTGLEFQSGKVIITRDGDFFTVEFDCIGKNGDVITGFYSGQIHYYDFAEEPESDNLKVLLNNLEYPKALFLDGTKLYYTETAARNTSFGGKLTLNSFDLTTNSNTVLKENPQNSDALVVINDDIYLSSYHTKSPGEYGKISIFNLLTKTENHFMDIEIATNSMCLDENNNFFLLGGSDMEDAKSLYKFPASNYANPSVLQYGLGRVRNIVYSKGYLYYASQNKINKYNGLDSTVVFIEKSGVYGMAISDNYLYYSSYGGNIGRINLTTKEDETMYSDLNRTADIAIDKQNNALYVLTHGTTDYQFKDGQLLRINNLE